MCNTNSTRTIVIVPRGIIITANQPEGCTSQGNAPNEWETQY